jgi:hypothetical protein
LYASGDFFVKAVIFREHTSEIALSLKNTL